MPKATLYYTNSAELTKAVSWVHKPCPMLPAQSAYKYCLLQQCDEEYSSLLAYASDGAWLSTRCKSQGPIGTTFLLDAPDLLQRVSKEDVWKRHSMLLSATKRHKLRAECVTEVQDDKVQAAGNIEINTYPGDTADFVLPPETDWQLYAQLLEGWTLLDQVKLFECFAAIKSNSARKPVWFQVKDNQLSILCSEKESNLGLAILCCQSKCLAHDFSFGIQAQYLNKAFQVFEQSSTIQIDFDDLDCPSKVRFSGDKGWVILPLIEADMVPELSIGAVSVFFNNLGQFETICQRVYHLTELSDRLALQRPKPDSRFKSVVLEEADNNLILSKLYDYEKHEMSTAASWTLDGQGDWLPIVIDFCHTDASLDTLEKYLTKVLQEIERDEPAPTDFDETPGPAIPKLVRLTLQKATTPWGDFSYYLYLEHPEFQDCRVAQLVGLKESMKDYQEPD